MGGLGPTEIILIAVVALILFGPDKIPEFAKQCGRAVSMFKRGIREGMDDEASVEKKKEEPAPKA